MKIIASRFETQLKLDFGCVDGREGKKAMNHCGVFCVRVALNGWNVSRGY
jgi:hypothetical protein